MSQKKPSQTYLFGITANWGEGKRCRNKARFSHFWTCPNENETRACLRLDSAVHTYRDYDYEGNETVGKAASAQRKSLPLRREDENRAQ